MADEIYINTGSTFQQPYQGQVTVNGQEPNIRNISGTYPANAQTPFTYQNRTPFTYRNPVNAQEPNIETNRVLLLIREQVKLRSLIDTRLHIRQVQDNQ